MEDHQLAPDDAKRIARAVKAGRVVEAIKLYREATGKSLLEAKEVIDGLISKLIAHDGELFAQLLAKL